MTFLSRCLLYNLSCRIYVETLRFFTESETNEDDHELHFSFLNIEYYLKKKKKKDFHCQFPFFLYFICT